MIEVGKMSKKVGRPTEYDKKYARMAQFCVEDSGFSMYKLAKLFDVDRTTIYRWIESQEEFRNGIKDGRRIFEGIGIHRSLVKRATGYPYTETTYERIENSDGSYTMVPTKKVKKQIPPDVAAIKHWQVNMDQANWSDKQQLDINQTDASFDQAERDTLKELARKMAADAKDANK